MTDYQPAPLLVGDDALHRRQLAQIINSMLEGHLNVAGKVTLTASATSTQIFDASIAPYSFIQLMPLTANAAAVTGLWFAPVFGSATIHHPSVAHSDLNFFYLSIG